ncbi:hypothetical protein Rt10032_c05g2337 [Rhodotorula toruloides]|uniref:Uncharacterized protein n=1 Tax=Rhodotorula toruloides TaxID=5286 RepID=A0A511KD59_RHOTO|nr:hypothetical protein Rt10032_c05g2337 [Rhodotorula toruloides]
MDDDDDEVQIFILPKKGKAPKEVRKRKASSGSPSGASSKRPRSSAIILNPTPTPTPLPPQLKVAALISGLSFRKKSSTTPVEASPTDDLDPLPFGLSGRIVLNPILSRTLTGYATIPTDEADRQFVFRPPPPFPVFSAFPPNAAEKGTDPLPTSLINKFVTIAIDGLSTSVTKELLLRFLYHNQHRLARQPLAIKRSDDVEEEYWEDEEGEYLDFTASFFIAYGSVEDAKLVVDGNNGKMLPNLEGHAHTITACLVRGDFPEQPTAGQLQVARQKELDVGWTWEDTSDEVRKIWWKARDIPYSRICPRYDASADGERTISDEYHAEADRILSRYTMAGHWHNLMNKIPKETAAIYDERRTAWIRWTERSDEEALASGEEESEWPTCVTRATERYLAKLKRDQEEEQAKREGEMQRAERVRIVAAFGGASSLPVPISYWYADSS